MKRFAAKDIYGVAQQLGRVSGILEFNTSGATQSSEQLIILKRAVGITVKMCENADLKFSCKLLTDFLRRIDSNSSPVLTEEIKNLADKFSERVMHELEEMAVYKIIPGREKYYDETVKLFGDQVATSFPSSMYDIEEAGRCLAVGRSTACIFHLMRAITPVWQRIAAELNFDEQRDWGRYLKEMNAGMWKKYPDNKTKENDAQREFYSDLEVHLRAYKEAYRNPTMHNPDKVYTEEKAEEIFGHVKGLMKKAAEKLKEQP